MAIKKLERNKNESDIEWLALMMMASQHVSERVLSDTLAELGIQDARGHEIASLHRWRHRLKGVDVMHARSLLADFDASGALEGDKADREPPATTAQSAAVPIELASVARDVEAVRTRSAWRGPRHTNPIYTRADPVARRLVREIGLATH